MTRAAGDLTTELPDLTGCSLRELRIGMDVSDAVARVLRQIERPRANIGGSGPPGRAD
jgi:hypothetical protein